MEQIKKYFPQLSPKQLDQLSMLFELYSEWNAKINVISRKDMEHFYEHHVLHSMAIAKFFDFKAGHRVLDVGTGGGFPGIPLAIMFPESHFTLVDSIAKKIKVVNAVIEAVGLTNVVAVQARVEEMNGKWDLVVSRAVSSLPEFMRLVYRRLPLKKSNQPIVLYLKGGDIEAELEDIILPTMVHDLTHTFDEEFFATKKLIKVY